MKRIYVIQLAAALAAISAFVLLLTIARLRFSGAQATNLLGVLQQQEAESELTGDSPEKDAGGFDQPMFCCPAKNSGMPCQPFDGLDEKCGTTDAQSGDFADGGEFQLTDVGLEACMAFCSDSRNP